jgi:hypothetical protein
VSALASLTCVQQSGRFSVKADTKWQLKPACSVENDPFPTSLLWHPGHAHALVDAPGTDDLNGIAWSNALTEKARGLWMRIAGNTGRAVDAWVAFKLAQGARDLDPKDVLVDMFEALHADDPEWLAEQVQRRLADAGFSIVPTDELPQASRASHYSG